MDTEIKDWLEFCEGNSDFDSNDFFTLLMDDSGKGKSRPSDEIELILNVFPEKEQLIESLNFYYSTTSKEKNINKLLEKVKLDLEQKKAFLVGEDDVLEVISKPIRFIDSVEEFKALGQDNGCQSEFISLVGDHFIDILKSDDDPYYGIKSAFYGLSANNIQLVWALMNPLFDTPFKEEHYLDIYKMGGVYKLTKEGVIVTFLS